MVISLAEKTSCRWQPAEKKKKREMEGARGSLLFPFWTYSIWVHGTAKGLVPQGTASFVGRPHVDAYRCKAAAASRTASAAGRAAAGLVRACEFESSDSRVAVTDRERFLQLGESRPASSAEAESGNPEKSHFSSREYVYFRNGQAK
jgi:hypothetical protein